jgi:hypothetical protein
MKRLFLVATFFVLLSAPAFARKDEGDFPLTIHITAVSVEQGQTGISGGGSTDSNGNYSASVSGGESYTWKLFTAQIEGDKKTYGLSTDRMHYKGGRGLAIATLGWSKVELLSGITGWALAIITDAGTKTERWRFNSLMQRAI